MLAMGKILSDDVLELHTRMESLEGVSLAAISKTYRAARRQPTEKDVAWAKEILADREACIEDKTYARELTDLYKHPKRFANVEIQALVIGDCAIATLPCEAYADIALEIRKHSPYKKMMISSLTNGTVGYVVTEPAFSAGVYESRLSKYNSFLTPADADEMSSCAVKLLKKLK